MCFSLLFDALATGEDCCEELGMLSHFYFLANRHVAAFSIGYRWLVLDGAE